MELKNRWHMMVLLTLILLPCRGQDMGSGLSGSPVAELVKRYQENIPNERIWVRTDRDIYFPGETILLSVVYTDDLSGIPVNRSLCSYVELMDPKGTALQQIKVLHREGQMFSSMELPGDLSSGEYYLRVYSLWQKQFGASCFGIKSIQLVNPYRPPGALGPSNREAEYRLHPEGGRIIEGLENRVAVEFRGSQGLCPEPEDAMVVNEGGDSVCRVHSRGRGLAFFTFRPEPGNRYFLHLDGGSRLEIPVVEDGSRLALVREDDNIHIRVHRSREESTAKGCLALMHEGWLLRETEIAAGLQDLHFILPGKDLPGGIVSFHLLDSRMEETSHRLVFVPPGNLGGGISLAGLEGEYQRNDSVRCILHPGNLPPDTRLSVCVGKQLFARSSPYPSSWLALHVHSQLNDWDDFARVFGNRAEVPDPELLDIYMLGRSPGRHSWQQIRSSDSFKLHGPAEYRSALIGGKIHTSPGSPSLAGKQLQLLISGSAPVILKSHCDSSGRFIMENPYPSPGDQVARFRIPEIAEAPAGIEIDQPYHSEKHPYLFQSFHFDSARVEEWDRAFVNWQLNRMIPGPDNLKSKGKDQYETPSFYGKAARRFYLADYLEFPGLEEVFREIIPYVRTRNRDNKKTFVVYDAGTNLVLGPDPLVMLNGQVVEDAGELLRVPEKEVEYVDVVARRFHAGDQVYDGVVNVVCFDPRYLLPSTVNSQQVLLEGYADSLEPGEGKPAMNENEPDLRSTLLWKSILAGDPGQLKLEFSLPMDGGSYFIRIDGVSPSGEIIHLENVFRVRE